MRTRSPEETAIGNRYRWQVGAVVLGAVFGLCAVAWQARRSYRRRCQRLRSAVERWEDEGGALRGRPE